MADLVKIEVPGLKAFQEKLRQYPAIFKEEAMKGLISWGANIQDEMVRSIQQVGSGRVYTRRGVTHQASSPGSPPSSDTGHLVNSIHQEVGDESVKVIAGDGEAPQAVALEFGTSKMAARPYAAPAVAKSQSFASHRMEQALKIATVRIGGGS